MIELSKNSERRKPSGESKATSGSLENKRGTEHTSRNCGQTKGCYGPLWLEPRDRLIKVAPVPYLAYPSLILSTSFGSTNHPKAV
jgi:hypothetical protein